MLRTFNESITVTDTLTKLVISLDRYVRKGVTVLTATRDKLVLGTKRKLNTLLTREQDTSVLKSKQDEIVITNKDDTPTTL